MQKPNALRILGRTFREQNKVANALSKEGVRDATFDVLTILKVFSISTQQILYRYYKNHLW